MIKMTKEKGEGRGLIEAFYTSREWRRAREAYRKKKIFCERCGVELGTQVHHKKRLTAANLSNPDISMGEGNLELLCDKCHEIEHGKHKNRADAWGHVALDPPRQK